MVVEEMVVEEEMVVVVVMEDPCGCAEHVCVCFWRAPVLRAPRECVQVEA